MAQDRKMDTGQGSDAPAQEPAQEFDSGASCYIWPRGPEVRRINIALQGGGAHGAFTWGVLDRFLEDERIAIDGISATSAGAINAALIAQGLASGGPDIARRELHDFWRGISEAAGSTFPLSAWLESMGWKPEVSPAHIWFDMASRLFSPYQFNPFNFNPLRDLLEKTIDVDRIRACHAVKLFISATNVESGKIRIFDHNEVTIEAILASTCLPHLFQAVEVDGQHYWDGGYMGNPALYPLIYHCEARDIVIIRINPIARPGVPTTSQEILNRLNEITFNSSLMRELRAIEFVTRLIDDGKMRENSMKRMMIHMVEADKLMTAYGVASKMNPDWNFLCHLRDMGRNCATQWIETHFDKLGVESTVDIRGEFL